MTAAAAATDRALARSILAVLPQLGRIAVGVGREHNTVTPQAGKLLFSLRGGPMRSGELADHCMLTRSAISELVDGLVAAGYVRREEAPDDRRAVVLSLTTSGARAIERFEGRFADAIQALLAHLDPRALDRVRAAFTDLEQALREARVVR